MDIPEKKLANVKIKLLSNGAAYPGKIESLADGIMYVTAASKEPSSDFEPGNLLDVNFHSLGGDDTSLRCKVKWSYRTPPHGITNSIGMEVLSSGARYEALLQVIN